MKPFFGISSAKRPAEELYRLRSDPDQDQNLATDPAHATTKAKLAAQVEAWMHDTHDPRVDPQNDAWDRFPYFGGRAKAP